MSRPVEPTPCHAGCGRGRHTSRSGSFERCGGAPILPGWRLMFDCGTSVHVQLRRFLPTMCQESPCPVKNLSSSCPNCDEGSDARYVGMPYTFMRGEENGGPRSEEISALF